MLCYTMLCYAMLYRTMLCYANAMLCYAVLRLLCYAMQGYAMQCQAMLCYATLSCTVQCYATPGKSPPKSPKIHKDQSQKSFKNLVGHVNLAQNNGWPMLMSPVTNDKPQ